MAVGRSLAPVNTVVYGQLSQGTGMADQLSAQDWLDQGLKTLARSGFTALKAERLAKAMGVSRGSFYWHFASLGAFHAAILKYWREVAAEQIIANLEAASTHDNPLSLLLRQAFGGRLALENAVRSWAMFDSAARAAVQAIDRRRLGYVEGLFRAAGLSPDVARARAQILYWAFLGFAQSDQPLSKAKQQAVLDELLRIASIENAAAPHSNVLDS
jgi:AcrR family transcriptional regulator